MHLANTLVGAVALFAATSSAAFTASCTNCKWIINKAVPAYMGCDCRKNDGSYVGAGIQLGKCFGNNNGNIQPQQNGFFANTCTWGGALGPAAGGALFMPVGCKRIDGSVNSFSYNLAATGTIQNDNGVLKCFGTN
ncbi:hypothetical protein B0H66DRAFT_590424 [Apodospora peruviana]|uniref:Cyanovirin-N domain-containing protein n=1 Tax=Apodospora peruviana TaxID=516989 RepID=A0AAE0ICR3_9PEZI|nr:hypothetical protein B0H66DRAFT_590424 [Apodospora peruviana]